MGEDSRHQFKQNITSQDSLAAEIVAFSNGQGGYIIIGVDDRGKIIGLTSEDIHRLNQMIANTSTQSVIPSVNVSIQNLKAGDKNVMIVSVPAGLNKPYNDNNGLFWVKNGADKRKTTSRYEILRMYQNANFIHADEMTTQNTSISECWFKI